MKKASSSPRSASRPAREIAPPSLSASARPGVPLYKEVRRMMVEAVSSGEWPPASAIPSEKVLASRFGVAMGTLRKAVDELVAEHVLIRQQGRGTFVARHDRARLMFHFFHIVGADGSKETPTVELHAFARGRADTDEAAHLAIAEGGPVFRIINILKIAGAPIIMDRIAIAQARFPGLTLTAFRDRPNTIYHLYQNSFGITVLRTAERLRAVSADAEGARALGVKTGSPLLEIRRTALTFNDEPVEYRRSLVNTAKHEYFSDLAKSS
jgi:GntR family transcriptional regulator